MLKAIFKEDLTFFVSNIPQESITKTDIIPSLSSHHSPILLAIKLNKEPQRGRGLWKLTTLSFLMKILSLKLQII